MLACCAMMACHRTAPQQPTRRSSETPPSDTTLMALMEVNHRMACEADKILISLADSLTKATGIEFAQMSCGGWKSRRDSLARKRGLYADSPKYDESWSVRLRTFHLDGTLVSDTEGVYKFHHFDLPIAVEEALEDMYTGEKAYVLAPWYTAYGIHGNQLIAGYENVRFEVTLGERK